MTGTIVTHEPLIRLGASVAVLLAMMLWEVAAPRRSQHYHRAQRWPHNLLLVALDSAAVRLLVPLGAVGAALVALGAPALAVLIFEVLELHQRPAQVLVEIGWGPARHRVRQIAEQRQPVAYLGHDRVSVPRLQQRRGRDLAPVMMVGQLAIERQRALERAEAGRVP